MKTAQQLQAHLNEMEKLGQISMNNWNIITEHLANIQNEMFNDEQTIKHLKIANTKNDKDWQEDNDDLNEIIKELNYDLHEANSSGKYWKDCDRQNDKDIIQLQKKIIKLQEQKLN